VVVVRPAGKGNEKGEENSDQCGTSEVFTECGVKGSHACEWELGMGDGGMLDGGANVPSGTLSSIGLQGQAGQAGPAGQTGWVYAVTTCVRTSGQASACSVAPGLCNTWRKI
jgi:hypothetical protein